ncbi:Rieske (2Fe-2S) protein [Pseudonocardia humida]|uniref:Cytochrome bc1 complex Rieske iron-sulfur subunit n=1 Tax=Pseudonocardia humida TaxID=2800819 RepID=A0ABT1A6Q6_9PSEU|nr:Rieske (2Fe-2S) protein [Pseudonocardia humida]MCO1658707.1 Rieske (2Fe-2S) protein [Pseudonocardia humida]
MPAPSETLSRRSVLAGACVTCAAAVAGCATYGPPTAPAPAPAPSAAPGAAAPPAGGAPALAQVADVPVGGGLIVGDTVITQPTAGEFKAFSTVCTHQGCAVSEIADGTINCLCHGSKFSVEDGEPTDGPANTALPAKEITVEGESITLA